ncbi:MAG: hypothetical protein VXW32_16305, partial [Myxococcota bacterium]|nr:hypothetical protein [Myxococcota bacterium]
MVKVPFCFAWIAALLAHGPQPIQDSLRRLRQPPQLEAPVAVVRVPLDAAHWTAEDRTQRLGSLLNLPLLDLTREIVPSENGMPMNAGGELFQLGRHWDGVHRSIRFSRTSPVRPFAEALGFDPLDANYDLRGAPRAPGGAGARVGGGGGRGR